MFNALHLGNFKAFGLTQRIPLKPLTLIFGPNSSGKSSIIHGLLFGHEASTVDDPTGFDVKRPRIGGESVDLGGFRQFVHRRNVSNRLEWGVEIETGRLEGRLKELLGATKAVTVFATVGIEQQQRTARAKVTGSGEEIDVPGEVEHSGRPRMESYRIETPEGVLLRASRKGTRSGWRVGVDELDLDNPVLKAAIEAMVMMGTTTAEIEADDATAIEKAVDALVPLLSLQGHGLFPSVVDWPRSEDGGSEHRLFPISRGTRQGDLVQAVQFYLPRVLNDVVSGLALELQRVFKGTRYLGPLRSYPARHLAFSQDHDTNWQAGGGWAWDRVRTDSTVRERVNAWLGSEKWMKTPYRIEVRDLVSLEDVRGPIGEQLYEYSIEQRNMLYHDLKELLPGALPEKQREALLEALLLRHQDVDRSTAEVEYTNDNWRRIAEGEHEAFADLVSEGVERLHDVELVDIRSSTRVSHRDIGIGISQVLPVLVSCFSAKNELLAMEQPELHLHPALQAELGDAFIEAALGRGNTCLLETHSEHLILRVLRRIRESTADKNHEGPRVRPEDVALIFVQPGSGGATAMELRVDVRGRLLDPCPGGFFEEDFQELF